MTDKIPTQAEFDASLALLEKAAVDVLKAQESIQAFVGVVEKFCAKAKTFLCWQDVGHVGDNEYTAVPRDRPILVMESWDVAPTIVWYDEEEDCWQYSDLTLSDNVGCCEEFVAWMDLIDTRFHVDVVGESRKLAEMTGEEPASE